MDADHFMSAIKQSGNGPMPILAQAHKLWIAKRQQDGVDYCSVFTETAVEVDEKGPLDFLPCAGWGNNNTKNENYSHNSSRSDCVHYKAMVLTNNHKYAISSSWTGWTFNRKNAEYIRYPGKY